MKKLILFTYALSITALSYAQGIWQAKRAFPNGARAGTEFFGIQGQGYLFGGITASGINQNDLWKYDPHTDLWTQVASMPAAARYSMAKIVIGTKAYVGTGFNNITYFSDWWEYSSLTNTWIQKANFPGGARYHSMGFGLNNLGYLGLGKAGGWYRDWYEYNPNTDTWTQKTDFPGTARQNGVGFASGNFGFVGLGADDNNAFSDMYMYDPLTDSWTPKADFPDGDGRYSAPFFVMNSQAYVCGGYNYTTLYHSDSYKYNVLTDTWSPIADFSNAGPARATKGGFSGGGKGYIAMGEAGSGFLGDLLEYSSDFVGIDEQENAELFQVHYYSATSILSVQNYGLNTSGSVIQLFSVNGQLVGKYKIESDKETKIKVPNLSAGLFIYSIYNTKQQIQQGKILVEFN